MKRLFAAAALVLAASLSLKAQPYTGPQTSPVYSVPDWEQVQANPSMVLSDYQPYPVQDQNPASIPPPP